MGHNGIGIQVVDVLVGGPALLIECDGFRGLIEHHDVMEDRPEEGRAEINISVEVLLGRKHGNVVVGCQELLDLCLVPVVCDMNPRPTDAHHSSFGLLSELLDQRQPREVSPICWRLLLHFPFPIFALRELDGKGDGNHENCVMRPDLCRRLQFVDGGHLVVVEQFHHLFVRVVEGRLHYLGIFVFSVKGTFSLELAVLTLIIFDDHLCARGLDFPVPLVSFPFLELPILAHDDILVFHHFVALEEHRLWANPTWKRVLAAGQRQGTARFPVS
mmetsp:Transcript_80297/g.167197  ORF Transcript_80297/g.167197 Transcript_80297/m.167197 type:complete len:273 (+) Transcript_80297:2610-3428(+)